MATDEPQAESQGRPLHVRDVRGSRHGSRPASGRQAEREDVPPVPGMRGALTPAFWNLREVMAHTRYGRTKIMKAVKLYRTSHGAQGLPVSQTDAGHALRFRPADVERWLAGEPPNRRRLRAAS